jgi:hypothetical protein
LAAEFLYPEGSLCSATNEVTPDLSTINTALLNGSFVLPSATYVHVLPEYNDDTDYSQQQFFVANFTLLQESVIHVSAVN